MFVSRLAAALRSGGGELIRAGDDAAPDSEVVFIDLNAHTEERLQLIASLRAHNPEAVIVAFCHHGEKQLREAAMHRGASQCVTNGALSEVALRLVPGAATVGDGV